MSSPNALPIFDGHNDALLRLYRAKESKGDDERTFFTHGTEGHLDLPRARAGGLGGGFFAVFVPPAAATLDATRTQTVTTKKGYVVPPVPPIDPAHAQQTAIKIIAGLFRLEEASDGHLRVVHTTDELTQCLREGTLAAVLHFEGAEPIDPTLDALSVFYRAGLRSLGIVWSRPNAFGHGVPFRFPHTPDIGPGLTDAGKDLVRACNRLGIMIDLAHLNERGFWDVAALSDAPLVATHTAAHALSPSSRNLTDRQIDAIGESDGVIGINFAVYDLRADGRREEDTPLTEIARHITYISERIGLDHIAFGSDFDGTTISREMGDAAGLPKLIQTLRTAGFDETALRKLTHENWIRVLGETWR